MCSQAEERLWSVRAADKDRDLSPPQTPRGETADWNCSYYANMIVVKVVDKGKYNKKNNTLSETISFTYVFKNDDRK